MNVRATSMMAIAALLAMTADAAQDNKSTSDQRDDLTRTNSTGGTIAGTATPTPQAAGTQGSGPRTAPATANEGRGGR
jgi:hypothetical protein